MAGILDDLFEDLVKEPETKDENPDEKGKPEDNPDSSAKEEDTPPEDDKPESVKSALFPTSKEW